MFPAFPDTATPARAARRVTSQRKYFGTDGIRGRVGEPPITPDFVLRLGWAAGRVLARNGRGPVLIGKDTRISGYMLESALEAGLSAAGVDVRLLGPVPTPGIAFLTRSTRAQAGIVISASHNPYWDNGIKFFGADGTKLPDAVELEIEAELEREFETVVPERLGKARRIADAGRRYIEFCKSRLEPAPDLRGLRIVVDCAHGAAYRIAPKVFEELGAVVHAIGVEPDGLNINMGCGATDTDALRNAVLGTGANLGVALDGDGDRLMLIDAAGDIVDGDESLFIIARAAAASLNGAVVGTQMSNYGLELALRGIGIELLRARVGDRYVLEMLQERGLRLGGEASGHIINLELSSTGDAILSALQVLAEMSRAGHTLKELKTGMRKFPQRLVNVAFRNGVDPGELPGIDDAVREAERQLGGSGRVLLRRSGTEPLLRIMVEGEDAEKVDTLVQALAARVETALARSGASA
jgi:phosphoglucosamine mutase